MAIDELKTFLAELQKNKELLIAIGMLLKQMKLQR